MSTLPGSITGTCPIGEEAGRVRAGGNPATPDPLPREHPVSGSVDGDPGSGRAARTLHRPDGATTGDRDSDRLLDLVEEAVGGEGVSALDWVGIAVEALGRVEVEGLGRAEREGLAATLGRAGAQVASLLCGVARSTMESEPGTDVGEMLRQATGLSARETKALVMVGKQLSDMPRVAERFAAGDITLGHAKALAAAAEEVGAETVNEAVELLDLAKGRPSDTFRRRVRNWSTRVALDRGMDPLERKQRARRGSMWVDWRTGMQVLRLETDPVSGNLMQQRIDKQYRKLWLKDSVGGQDPDEIRTPSQRLADAIFELVTHRDAFSYEPLTDIDGRAGTAVQAVVKVDLAEVLGVNATGICEIVGTGPVPRRVLEKLSPDTELVSMIFAGPGRVLWMGRRTRLGNAPQRLAVAIRDGGCFECGAPMHRCQLHHVREWHRDRGPTDIDNLVAVCARHHRWITDNSLVVRRTDDGWQAQPRDPPNPAST